MKKTFYLAVILTALLCDSMVNGTPGRTCLKKTNSISQSPQAADVQQPKKRKSKGTVQYNISGGSDLSENRPKNAGSSPRKSLDGEEDINDKLPPHKKYGDMYTHQFTSSNQNSSPTRGDNPPIKYDSIRFPIDRKSLEGSRKDYSRSGSGSGKRPFRWLLPGSLIKRSGSTASSIDWGSPSRSEGIKVPIPKPYANPDGKMLLHLTPGNWKSLEKLKISFGDVVVCHLVEKRTFRWRKFHWLLATSEDSLVHVYPRDDNNLGVIGSSKKEEISSKFKRCSVNSCKNLGNGGHEPSVTYVRVQQWINRYVFYDEKSCSSYHWLVYWVTGHTPRKSFPGVSKDLHEDCRLLDAGNESFAPDDDTDVMVATDLQAKERAGNIQRDSRSKDYSSDDSVLPFTRSSPPPPTYSSPPSPPYGRSSSGPKSH